jgi:hypothetical protein
MYTYQTEIKGVTLVSNLRGMRMEFWNMRERGAKPSCSFTTTGIVAL